MELHLDNIGILKNSSITLDGLTVITGKNSTGKTTVGKVLYALIQANSNLESAYVDEALHMGSQLNTIRERQSGSTRTERQKLMDMPFCPDTVKQALDLRTDQSYRYSPTGKVCWSLKAIGEALNKITLKNAVKVSRQYSKYTPHMLSEACETNTSSKSLEERKESAVKVCSNAASAADHAEAFDPFRNECIRDSLNSLFCRQIIPVKPSSQVGHILITDNHKTVLNLKIRNSSDFEFAENCSFAFPYRRAIFVDDPFILDHIRENVSPGRNDGISTVDIASPRESLINMLTSKSSDSFSDNLEFRKNHRDIIGKMNMTVPGEFRETGEGLFYVDHGSELNVQNLAAGSKLFLILKLLFMNGHLTKDTVLILDGPESHLHPAWINRFAEILVLLIKEAKLHVLLTTHSPNLLLALDVYAKSHGIDGLSHFYLAEIPEHSRAAELTCIDDDINAGYAHLSLPLIEMTIMQKGLAEN